MPKVSNLPHTTSTVLMFDTVFDPVSEKRNRSPQFNSVNPANRYRSIATRHSAGAIISFCDGHRCLFQDDCRNQYLLRNHRLR